MVTKTNGMLKRMSRRMSSAPDVDCADDTSSYLFLSQKAAAAAAAAAHYDPCKSNQIKNKKPKSKQREQRTSAEKKMQKKLVILTKSISNNFGDAVSIRKPALAAADKKSRPTSTSSSTSSIVRRMTSKMTKLPGRLHHHRRSPSSTTATTDADTSFGTHESSESASGIAIDASLEFAPAITEDDARSLGTSGTTATGATAQVGNLTKNAHNNDVNCSIGPGVLSTILDVSVDFSQGGDNGEEDDSCDDDFEEDPIIIAGSRSVNIDYVFQEPQISPNATGRRKHYQGATSGGNSRDGQEKSQGALAKSSIFVNHSTSTGASYDQANASSPGVPPPISLATPVISSSFTPNVINIPTAATGYSSGDNLEREQPRQQEERVGVLERFLDRFSCGTGCDSAYSIYEM